MPAKQGLDPQETNTATTQRARGAGQGVRWAHGTAALGVLAIAGAVSCGELGGLGNVGAVVCPELGGPGDVLSANFAANARANAKVRTFVQAAKDMAAVSAAIEAETAAACR